MGGERVVLDDPQLRCSGPGMQFARCVADGDIEIVEHYGHAGNRFAGWRRDSQGHLLRAGHKCDSSSSAASAPATRAGIEKLGQERWRIILRSDALQVSGYRVARGAAPCA